MNIERPGEASGHPSAPDVRSALLARRVVLVHGNLDGPAAAEAAASLMLLDAAGDGRVVLRLTAASASFETALSLVDVLSVSGVPVDTVGLGTISGGAVAVLCAGRHRVLGPTSRLHLAEPDVEVAGRVSEIERALAHHAGRRDRLWGLLSERTGRPHRDVEAEWLARRVLDAPDAVTLGYADAVGAGEDPRRAATAG